MQSVVVEELQAMVGEARAGRPVLPAFVIVAAAEPKRFKIPLPPTDRASRLDLVGCLAAWLGATVVVFSEVAEEPKRVITTGLGRSGVVVATAPVKSTPEGVAPISWLPVSAVGVDVLRLRPRDDRQFSGALIGILEDMFGPRATAPTSPTSRKIATAEAEEWGLLFG